GRLADDFGRRGEPRPAIAGFAEIGRPEESLQTDERIIVIEEPDAIDFIRRRIRDGNLVEGFRRIHSSCLGKVNAMKANKYIHRLRRFSQISQPDLSTGTKGITEH